MATNLAIEPDRLNRAVALSGARTKTAAVTSGNTSDQRANGKSVVTTRLHRSNKMRTILDTAN